MDDYAASDPYAIPQDKDRAKELRNACMKWYRSTAVDAFDRVGNRTAPWADKARKAMEARSKELAGSTLHTVTDHAAQVDSDAMIRAAIAAGCDDPLIRYWGRSLDLRLNRVVWRQTLDQDKPVTQAMVNGPYPAIRKLNAVHNFLAGLNTIGETHPGFAEQAEWDRRFWTLFEQVVQEHNPFADENLIEIAELRERMKVKGQTRESRHAEIDRALVRAKASKHLRLTIQGLFLISHAWDARGSGTADTVTPEGSRLMVERLVAAKDALTKAWKLEPNNWHAANGMITVCMGLSLDREEMERWFERAMKANPDNYAACTAKLMYLSPKWHGTVQEYLSFAWKCVRTENGDGFLPFAVTQSFFLDSQSYLYERQETRDRVRAFYEDRRVWAVIRQAMKIQLTRRPDDRHIRSQFARAACLAGRYELALREFELLGDQFESGVFSGKPEYDAFRNEAAAGCQQSPPGQAPGTPGRAEQYRGP